MSTERVRQTDAWEKWDWLWGAIFNVAVLGSTIWMLLDADRAAPVWVALLLTAVLLVWHWAGMRLAYRNVDNWDENVLPRFVVIIGDIVLWFILLNISYAYYFVLFGFGQIFRHLPIRYAATAAAVLIVAIIYEEVSDSGETLSLTSPAIWLPAFMGVVAIILGIWISAIIGQSVRRKQLIEQLESAQAELSAAERREGVLEERQRLAREIHDTLAQGFTSIVMHLEAAEQALPGDLDTLQKHLDEARNTARISLDEARRVVQDLRPDLLENQSLPDAIERAAVRWRRETGIPLITATTGNPVVLHPNIEVTLLRATQEALNNIRKHAQATEVQLTLSYMEDVVVLDVQDNGQGIDGEVPRTESGGYGLLAMRERAEHCGGFVTLESDPGEGTTVVVTIPLNG